MTNYNLDDYIKDMDLSPELENKARLCKTGDELLDLAAEHDVELPMEALDVVSGGDDCDNYDACPEGGKHSWKFFPHCRRCIKCGKEISNYSPKASSRSFI